MQLLQLFELTDMEEKPSGEKRWPHKNDTTENLDSFIPFLYDWMTHNNEKKINNFNDEGKKNYRDLHIHFQVLWNPDPRPSLLAPYPETANVSMPEI